MQTNISSLNQFSIPLEFHTEVLTGRVLVRDATGEERRECIPKDVERILGEYGLDLKGHVLKKPIGTVTFGIKPFPAVFTVKTLKALPERCCLLQFRDSDVIFAVYFLTDVDSEVFGFADRLKQASTWLPKCHPFTSDEVKRMQDASEGIKKRLNLSVCEVLNDEVNVYA